MPSKDQASNGYTKIQYRVLYCEPGKPAEDRSSNSNIYFSIGDESELARDILRECENRLLLLKVALDGKQSIDSSLVKTVIDDVLIEIKDGGVIPDHLESLARMFKHAEVLPPPRTAGGDPKLEIVPKRRSSTESISEPSLVS